MSFAKTDSRTFLRTRDCLFFSFFVKEDNTSKLVKKSLIHDFFAEKQQKSDKNPKKAK